MRNRAEETLAEPPRLIWADKQPAPEGLGSIILNGTEIIIGRDARQCQIVLKMPTVEKVHAIITLAEDGHARIANRSVKNGTWLNFAPVSSAGAILHSGDLIHFGKVAFRYQIGNTGKQFPENQKSA